MGPEARLEHKIKKAVENAGGKCLKLIGAPGLPDRLCILPGARFVFIEMKAEGGELSPLQRLTIGKLRRLGCDTRVIEGAQQTAAFIQEVKEWWRS